MNATRRLPIAAVVAFLLVTAGATAPVVADPSSGTATLSGTVREAGTDVVIAGASVDYLGSGPSLHTVTDSAGHYSFSGLAATDPSWGAQLQISKSGTYYSKMLNVIIADGAVVVRNTTLTPVQTGTTTISGGVSIGGDEFTGHVSLSTWGWASVGSVVVADSGPDGVVEFSFTALPAGKYHLMAWAEGAPTTMLDIDLTSAPSATRNIVLTPYPVGTGTLRGRVVDTRTGAPIAGASVQVSPTFGATLAVPQNATTGSDGRWQVTALTDGSYTVVATNRDPYGIPLPAPSGAAGWAISYDQAQVDLDPAESTTLPDLELRSYLPGTSVLEGRIRDSVTHLPVGGVLVTAYAFGAEAGSAVTDESGTFRLEGLTEGDTFVAVSADGYYSRDATVLVEDATTSVVVPIAPRPVGGDGTVTFTVQHGSVAIDDARLWGTKDDDPESYFQVSVDEDGRATVSGLSVGDWTVQVSATDPVGGNRVFAPAHVRVVDGTPQSVLIRDSTQVRVSGRVDLNGFIPDDVLVVAFDEAGACLGTGNPAGDGTYEMTDLPSTDMRIALVTATINCYGGAMYTASAELGVATVWADGHGGQTPEREDARVIDGSDTTRYTGFDFTALAGGSARAAIRLSSASGATIPPASRCFTMTPYRLEGGVWDEYGYGWDYGCGGESLLSIGLPAGQYKFEFADVNSGSTAFQTAYNGGASSLAAAPAITITDGQIADLGVVTAHVPSPSESSLEALDLDFLASDPGFDLSAYEDQVTTVDEPQAGEETEVEVGEEFAGQWVNVSLNSTPVVVGSAWHQVAADGTVTVRLPSDVDGSHRLAVGDSEGHLIGWTGVEIAEAAPTSSGGSTGTGGGSASSGSKPAAKPSSTSSGSDTAATPSPTATPAPTVTPEPTLTAQPAEAAPEPAAAPAAPDTGWVLWVVLGGLVILVGAGAVILFLRRAA